MIPINEIQRVIKTLQGAANSCMSSNNYNKADAYNSAIHLLKELLPK